jgi:hypothetical protein
MRRQLVQRIDPEKAYPYFLREEGWSKADVDDQVLTALDGRTIFGTPPDDTSIMCYQLPGEITKDGRPIVGGLRINATDHAFAARVYPKPAAAKKGATKKGATKAAKRPNAKKTAAKKATANKTTAKKATVRKATVRKATAKKTSARKATAKRATTKRPAKKAAARRRA